MDITIDLVCDISGFRRELAKVPGITEDQAKAAAGHFRTRIKKVRSLVGEIKRRTGRLGHRPQRRGSPA